MRRVWNSWGDHARGHRNAVFHATGLHIPNPPLFLFINNSALAKNVQQH